VIALARMRLVAYVRTGRFLPPTVSGLLVLSILYGGGRAQAGEAYGVSAIVLFPVLAWQTKLLLDGEPDVQRRLARVAVGSAAREISAGLFAAVVAACALVPVALVLPWILNGVEGPQQPGDPSLGSAVAVGLWAHVVVIPPAIALGAWASRAVTGTFGRGTAVLVTGVVLALVLGLKSSPLWWLAPPMLSLARLAQRGFVVVAVLGLTAQALVWTAVTIAGYARLRRRRA
jgi:hypothetical protein